MSKESAQTITITHLNEVDRSTEEGKLLLAACTVIKQSPQIWMNFKTWDGTRINPENLITELKKVIETADSF